MSQKGTALPSRPNPLVEDTKNRVGLTGVDQTQTGDIGEEDWQGRVDEPRAEGYQLSLEERVESRFEREVRKWNEGHGAILGPLSAEALRQLKKAIEEEEEANMEYENDSFESESVIDLLEEIKKEKENQLPKHNLKKDIVDGIKEALGIRDPVPLYKPNKETRDLNRLSSLNRIPPSKVWSREELEYFNRKGKVTYNIKNVQGKHLPTVFNPKLPTLGFQQQPPSLAYSKPNFYVSSGRVDQGNNMPTSFLVN